MKHSFLFAVALVLALLAPLAVEGAESGTMLAHNVFFTLKEKTPAAQEKLVDACHKYLKKQKGVVTFFAGKREAGLTREVNDLDFDVSLHIVFRTAADQEIYQKDAQHLKFIEENADTWAKVRVFDSLVR
ncbi:MAG: Dabb family protein [Bryobacterales bacterium]|nr:Dabb family protein [Bryobacterales bacterium]